MKLNNIEKTVETFEIYQIKKGEELRAVRFENIDMLNKLGLKVDYNNYDYIYSGKLEENMELEDIFEKFNLDRPDNFKGHSLSVSDVVILNKKGELTAHFVDSFGFKEVPEFIYVKENSLLATLRLNKEKIDKEDKNIKKLNIKMNLDER
jgi:hypothetical protein